MRAGRLRASGARLFFWLGVPLLSAWGMACAPTNKAPSTPALYEMRAASVDQLTSNELGRLVLLEMIAPGGEGAAKLRVKLEKADRSPYRSLALAFDDDVHGELEGATRYYLEALEDLRRSTLPEAELLATYGAARLLVLRSEVSTGWDTAAPKVRALLDDPGRLGERAIADLVELWSYDALRIPGADQARVRAEAAARLGCVREARFAGPFGRGVPSDLMAKTAAEEPWTWPAAFFDPARPEAEPARITAAELVDGLCSLASPKTASGTYVVEAFRTLDAPADVVLTLRGALSILVDDTEVMTFDPRDFGSFARSSVTLRLSAGTHRIRAHIVTPATTIRLTDLHGLPIGSDASPKSAAFSISPPTRLPDTNVLAPFYARASIKSDPVAPAAFDPADPIFTFFAGELFARWGFSDVATVLVTPLVAEPSKATAASLALAASAVENDPIFPETDARDLALDHRQRSLEKDSRNVRAALWVLIDEIKKQGGRDTLVKLEELARDFPGVPAVGITLGALYAKLGYRTEQRRTVLDLAARFPRELNVERARLSILSEEGKVKEAAELAARLDAEEPGATFTADRLIAEGEFKQAAEALRASAERLSGAARIAMLDRAKDLDTRAGATMPSVAALEESLAHDPKSERLILNLADARLAGGDPEALEKGLAHALLNGVPDAPLRDAISLVTGRSELEPFRIDGLEVIAAFEASGAAQAGLDKKHGGTAARVLDYAAVWVHDDGSARMLEHEILHMQSPEAISAHVEQKLSRGKLLKARTVKRDGSTFEPELIAGKPTLTMPHLAIGDYIETETLYELSAGPRKGERFMSPTWFFREEKIDYQRSEFVLITPKDRPLTIETTGNVPAPQITELGRTVVLRFRVDNAKAVPDEPWSAPAREFLPSVRAGWGLSAESALEEMYDSSVRITPADPRLTRIAEAIASGGAAESEARAVIEKLPKEERAKRIYRWVQDNIEPGRESDPLKSVVGKSGNPFEAFLYLSRLVGVDVRHAVISDRLRPAPKGPFQEAERYSVIAAVIPTSDGGELWTAFTGQKYTPFGYLPSSAQGQPAVIMKPGLPRVTSGTGGPENGVLHRGKVKLAKDGSATFALEEHFTGEVATVLRKQIQQISEPERLRTAIEGELLPKSLPGAKVRSLAVRNLEDVDAPLILVLDLEISSFASRQSGALSFVPPFSNTIGLSSFARAEARETPLLIPPSAALRVEVDVTIELPKGATLEGNPAAIDAHDQDRSVVVRDRVDGTSLVLSRIETIPLGRVEPSDYPKFSEFAHLVDDALGRDITIRLP